MSESITPVRKYKPVAKDTIVPLRDLPQNGAVTEKVREIGGRADGPDPTRYGDWEKNGRCIDF